MLPTCLWLLKSYLHCDYNHLNCFTFLFLCRFLCFPFKIVVNHINVHVSFCEWKLQQIYTLLLHQHGYRWIKLICKLNWERCDLFFVDLYEYISNILLCYHSKGTFANPLLTFQFDFQTLLQDSANQNMTCLTSILKRASNTNRLKVALARCVRYWIVKMCCILTCHWIV